MSIFHPKYLFENCFHSMKPISSQLWRIPMIIWHRAQLAMLDKSYLQGTQIGSDVKTPWRMIRGIKRTFPRPFSETFWISKTKSSTAHTSKSKTNFSNSFETVLRVLKSWDRDKLVNAIQLTFKILFQSRENWAYARFPVVLLKLKCSQNDIAILTLFKSKKPLNDKMH